MSLHSRLHRLERSQPRGDTISQLSDAELNARLRPYLWADPRFAGRDVDALLREGTDPALLAWLKEGV